MQTGAATMAAQLQAQQQLKIGIIGCGARARQHWGALLKMPDARITALADVESDRMAEVNGQLAEKAATYTDYRELLKDSNVGVVVIVTPGYLHHEMALAALRAGKDVVLEKPLAMNYAQAKEIERETARTKRILAVCMQRRYMKPDAETRDAVENGAIGAIRLITCTEMRGDWNPRTWQYTDPASGKKTSWRLLKKTAGSTELEFSVHAFAEVCSLVKSPVVRVAATGGVVHYRDRDTRDVSSLIADFGNGARFSYAFSCFAAGGGNTFSIVGDKGVLTRSGGKVLIRRERGREEVWTPATPVSGEDAETQLYRDFFRNVRERSQPLLSVAAAMEPAKLAFAAEISIAENRMVTARDFA